MKKTTYKTKKIKFRIPIDLFEAGIEFVISKNKFEVLTELNNERGTEYNVEEQFEALCIRSTDYEPLIILDKIPETTKEVGTLVHEILHAVKGIFEYIGISTIDSSNEEIWANAIGFVVSEFFEKAAKYEKKVQKRTRKSNK